jgi:hypothetical protein
MKFLEIFAAIGLFAGDIFAAVGLFGAAFLCLWMMAGRRMRRVPETMWVWAWAGTLLGGLCFVSILITHTPAEKIGFMFGWPPSFVGGLLALAVALLGLSVALHVSRKPEPRKQSVGRRR